MVNEANTASADTRHTPQGQSGCEECARLRDVNADLLEALQSVLRVADRKTVEFDAARAAINKALGKE